MKYAIVESGGKQYKAVEGETIDVDRLPVEVGGQVDLKSVLLTVDGKDVTVGNPSVAGIQVSTTVVSHFKGPKIAVFKYSPKKRIRVRSGHRQQYTRLHVEVIGKPGEARKAAKVEKTEATPKTEAVKAPKVPASAKKAATAKATRPAAKKTGAAKPATKAAPKKTTGTKAPAKTSGKKSTASKTTAKKSTTGKTPAKKSTTSKAPTRKPSTTKTKKTTK